MKTTASLTENKFYHKAKIAGEAQKTPDSLEIALRRAPTLDRD